MLNRIKSFTQHANGKSVWRLSKKHDNSVGGKCNKHVLCHKTYGCTRTVNHTSTSKINNFVIYNGKRETFSMQNRLELIYDIRTDELCSWSVLSLVAGQPQCYLNFRFFICLLVTGCGESRVRCGLSGTDINSKNRVRDFEEFCVYFVLRLTEHDNLYYVWNSVIYIGLCMCFETNERIDRSKF